MRRLLGTPARDYAVPAVLLLLTIGFLVLTYRLTPASRAMPVLVGWTMLLLLALDLLSRSRTAVGSGLRRWLAPASEAPSAAEQRKPGPRNPLPSLLWVAGFVTALVLIGVLCAVPLFILGSLRLKGGRPWRQSLIATGLATLVIWLLFSVLLQIELFPGLLLGGQW